MTLFSTLHRDLEIPDGYHLTGHLSVKAPSITIIDRRVAIDKLHAAGDIGGKDPEDILHGICARLARLPGHWAGRIEKPIINKCPIDADTAPILRDKGGRARSALSASNASKTSRSAPRTGEEATDHPKVAK